MMQKLLTVADVADLLQVSRSAIYAWVAEGYLPAVVMHRGSKKPVVRFRPETIDAFIAQMEKEQTDIIDSRCSEKEDFTKKVAHLTRKLGG